MSICSIGGTPSWSTSLSKREKCIFGLKSKPLKKPKKHLKALSKNHTIYVATSAQESTESEIQQAFERVGLDPYINGYFCKANLALEKNSPEFYQAILESLGDSASQVTMVGDNLDKDIYPALEAGLQAIYYNPQRTQVPEGINSVSRLSKLLAAN